MDVTYSKGLCFFQVVSSLFVLCASTSTLLLYVSINDNNYLCYCSLVTVYVYSQDYLSDRVREVQGYVYVLYVVREYRHCPMVPHQRYTKPTYSVRSVLGLHQVKFSYFVRVCVVVSNVTYYVPRGDYNLIYFSQVRTRV